MPKYQIALSDGRKFVVEADAEPSEADILAYLDAGPPAAPDPRVVAAQDALDPESAALRRIYASRPGLKAEIDQEADVAAQELPWAVGGAVAGYALPGVMAKAAPYAPGIVQKGVAKTAEVLSKPVVGGALGAYDGYRRGGWIGALMGGAMGAAGSGGKRVDVAGGMSQAGKAAAKPPTPMLDALLRGDSADDLAALAKGVQKPPVSIPKPRLSGLEAELAARETLSKPIDWRAMDITPVKRPAQNILFGEESTPGLLRMLEDAQLAKNPQLVEQVQKAIRQRSHITGKSR